MGPFTGESRYPFFSVAMLKNGPRLSSGRDYD
jgi:hypothetical protein